MSGENEIKSINAEAARKAHEKQLLARGYSAKRAFDESCKWIAKDWK